MLMIWCHHSRSNDCAIWNGIANINWTCGDYARCSHFVVDRAGLIELESKDILIVSNCDYCLENEESRSSYNCHFGSIVGVLPEDAVINFMTADNIRNFDRISGTGMIILINILDVAKTVTS
jgi:hypothetical protein